MGEPINPAAWEWYYRVIGKRPLSDCGYVVANRDWGHHDLTAARSNAAEARFGHLAASRSGCSISSTPKGNILGNNREGYLLIRNPWPSMVRTIWGDPKRFQEQYWSRVPGSYFTGDAARRDDDGYYWILGRVDDVMNVSGHRLEHHGGGIGSGPPPIGRGGGRGRLSPTRLPGKQSAPSSL